VDWRMCVDYMDLNKHCPKDPFGLPRIDQVVDSTAGCSVLSFLDCYSGYHQISLAKEDEEKTTFITPFGAFCYTSMPFGLKNARATYQRAIQTCLADHWGKRVEAYVDDVVIKRKIRKISLKIYSWFSIVYDDIDGSLIPKNVSSGYQQESYSGLLPSTRELKLIQKRSKLS
jgi:hypothetical protein